MTDNERKFVERYLEYYNKYNGNIPYEVLTEQGLSDYRRSLGISLKRSEEITNEAISRKSNPSKSSVVDIFKRELDNWLGFANDTDCSTYLNHNRNGNMYLPQFRANFKIGTDEEILFTRDTSFWNSHNQGMVITDKAIYVLPNNDKPDDISVYSWYDFDNVVYHDDKFYFYRGNEEIVWLGFLFFTKFNSRTFGGGPGPGNNPKLEKIAQVFTKIAKSVDSPYDSIERLLDEEKYDESLELSNRLISTDTSDLRARYYKHVSLKKIGLENENNPDKLKLNESLKEANSLIKILPQEDKLDFSILYQSMAQCYNALGDKEKGRECLILALDVDDIDEERDALDALNKIENELKEQWSQYTGLHDYSYRRLIMPIKDTDIAGCIADDIKTFRISHIPSDFVFPLSIPMPNQLYIGHRYNPGVYVPFEESDVYFFIDKVNELCKLLHCLGAKSVSIKSVKGKKIGEIDAKDYSINGKAEYGNIVDLNVEYNKSSNIKKENESHSDYERILTFGKPTHKPFLPDELHWYNHVNDWKSIAQERMSNNGSVLTYHEKISTSQTKFYTSGELESINGSVKVLLAKVSANAKEKIEKEYKESSETIWEFDAEFWPTDISSDHTANQANLTEVEKNYLNTIKDFAANGIIYEEEIPFVEQIRKKLNISEGRAFIIEQMLHLTESEKSYVDLYRKLSAHGDLTKDDLRKLERYRTMMEIPDERVKEIINGI